MKSLCVCKICNCGRHFCIREPTSLYIKDTQGVDVSEYTEKYPGYKNCYPPKSLKPKHEVQKICEPMEDITTFRSDFVPYEVTSRPVKKKVEYQPFPGKIDLSTTYKLQFTPYEIKPVFPRRPKEMIRGAKGTMDTIPTYKEHFCVWDINKRESLKPKVSYHPPTEKFGNATTFQDDFIPRGLVPRESFKPETLTKLSDAPFDGVTSNQLDYVPHPLDLHLVKAPLEYKPSDQPFQDLTTHRHDFQGLPGQMPKSCKPEYSRISYDTPFQSSTEFRDRFQPWDTSPPHLHKAVHKYLSPTEPMDMTTTTGTTYIEHHIQPFIPVRPKSRPTCSSEPFDGTTTMKEDFQHWKAHRQELIRQPQEIHRGSGKMEDTTTFKAHFIQHQLQPNISCKPDTAPLRCEEPFDGDTTYRIEFTPKKISVCPASFETIPGFVFERVDDRGHRFFRELSSQEQTCAECEL
ncbi:stabilizer of axonemal microtubules 2 [Tachysurus fulvidraco]|uniref:stabilizer of axonemal microtubules 2 n=1 Tax=Tachysurus fulvidraco TaxID=1234273 RepID=UPI000F4EF370|nr:stabilizer of axonemal microtubules 2 [Tachysurus fulvidraco]